MRILVADDDATSRLVLKTMATRQGHECLDAPDGSTAWKLLATHPIEVLLTDWMMPGLDGPDLCRQVREELTDRYIYIVLITGLGQREQILEGMSAGADDYLVKPVDPFSVQTRLVAAERVTALHRQVAHFRSELEKANLELLGQSLTDPLTGLGNRRRMDQDLIRNHNLAEHGGRPYSLVLFDIDFFKLYNDRYGHLAGDEALREVARCLSAHARASDSSYRYGGEEFLVVMPDCPPDEAARVANRVCRAAAERALPHSARPTGEAILTLSAGVACWSPGSGASETELIQQADQALYRAKRNGRNRVEVGISGPSNPLQALVARGADAH